MTVCVFFSFIPSISSHKMFIISILERCYLGWGAGEEGKIEDIFKKKRKIEVPFFFYYYLLFLKIQSFVQCNISFILK